MASARQLLALVLLASGCTRGPLAPTQQLDAALATADASAPALDAGLDAGGADEDAGAPYQLQLWLRGDGGLLPVALDGGLAALVDPTGGLVLEVSPRPMDARVRLFDAADLVVDSDDTATALDGGWRYALSLLEPLRAGRSYTLVLDAEQGPGLVDARGRALDDVRLGIQVRGDAAPDGASPAKRKRKAR
jgi:hypothetical protein